jgi:prophage regulatory protein
LQGNDVRSRLLKFDELKDLKGISYTRVHLLRLEKLGKFPRRVRLSDVTVKWDEDEIDAWVEAKKNQRTVVSSPAPIPLRKLAR